MSRSERWDAMLRGATLAFLVVALTYTLWGNRDAWLWLGFACLAMALKSVQALLVRRSIGGGGSGDGGGGGGKGGLLYVEVTGNMTIERSE